jgi:hypothetical protein
LRNASPMPLPNNSKPLSSTMPPINTSNPSQKKEGQKYFLGQQPDETLKMVIRKHPLFLVSPVLPLLGSIALLFLMLWFAPSLPLFHVIWLILEVGAGFLILFTAAYFVYKVFILWRYEANILTDKRIINWSSSFLNPSREESSIANIRQVAIDQESFLGVLLNYGTVHVYITRGELVMKNVPNPTSVRNAILSAREILIQIRYQGEHSSSTLYAKQDDKGRGSGEIK